MAKTAPHSKRMHKILAFNGYYFPARKYGGPATSLANIIQACGDEFEFYVIAHNHDVGESTPFGDIHEGWNQVGKAQVLYLPDSQCRLARYLSIIDEVMPSMIWSCGVWSPNSAKLFRQADRLGIAALMSPRGALNPLAVRYRWYKKLPFLVYLRLCGYYRKAFFHVTGPDECHGTRKYLGVSKDRIYNIANLSVAEIASVDLPKESGKLRMVYVSRISQTKNLLYALECLKNCPGGIQFDIYGPLEDHQYWSKCQEKIGELPAGVTVNYCGTLAACEVVGTFARYHCAFLPTRTENYGHAIVEAMQAGCWVLLSRGTTPWDGIHGKAGDVFPLDEPGQFVGRIVRLLEMDDAEYRGLRHQCQEFIREKLDNGGLREEYLAMFREICGTRNGGTR